MAFKIHFQARKPVDILALSDPEAHELLARHYPGGWEHDFYVIDERGSAKGVRSLSRLREHLGTRQLTALMSEYASAKVSGKRAALDHEHVDGEVVPTGRRNLLKGAALGAVAVPLAGMPKAANAFDEAKPSYLVNFAEAKPQAGGGVGVRAWRDSSAMRRTAHYPRTLANESDGEVHRSEDIVRDNVVPGLGSLKMHKAQISRADRSMVTYGAALDSDRYTITLNVGYGDVQASNGRTKATTMSAGISHDLAAPVADVVTFNGAEDQTVAEYLQAYRTSLGELRKLHQKEGRGEFARLYADIERGMARLAKDFIEVVPDSYTPARDKMVVSSTPEILKFVDYPKAFNSRVPEGGCDCACGCGICCGCGCSVGVCTRPGCGCGCCIFSCGCGCSCCV